MKFTEAQLAEIATIQEQRSLTRKSAVQFYSRQLKKQQADSAKETKPVASPAEILMTQPRSFYARGSVKIGYRNPAPPKPGEKTGKPEKEEAPARKHEVTDRIELTPIADSRAFTARRGAIVVCLVERNRAVAAARWNSLGVSTKAYDAALKASKALGLPLMVGAQVRVAGRWDSGWLIPATLYKKNLVAESDFNLSKTARIAYAADSESLAGGVQFEITKA